MTYANIVWIVAGLDQQDTGNLDGVLYSDIYVFIKLWNCVQMLAFIIFLKAEFTSNQTDGARLHRINISILVWIMNLHWWWWWNYLSIPKLQRFHRWIWGMNKYRKSTLYNGCNYLSMLGSRLIHVGKWGSRFQIGFVPSKASYFVKWWRDQVPHAVHSTSYKIDAIL